MSSNIKIELNRAAVGELRKGPEMHADIARRCAAIAAAATNASTIPDADFGHDVVAGNNRAHGMVWTSNFEAILAEATDRTLTRAIDAGRG